jgi:glycosyltransferase involved in cell wall biosynthesis
MSRTGPKVAFYAQGLRTPSSRFRVQQLLPALRREGLVCQVYAANPSNQGETEHWSPPRSLRALFSYAGVLSRLSQQARARRHDVLVFQKPLLPFMTSLFERRLARIRPCVFDLDDALYVKKGGRKWIQGIAQACARVIAGNAHLAEQLGVPDRTLIIPTVVDSERYLPRPLPDRPFTIGWTGVASNLAEFDPLVPVLRRVLEETRGRLLLVCERFPRAWIKSLPVDTVRWTPQVEVEALADIHVGIMPLSDTPFNRGKCGFKLLQYMARGVPVVASPVGVNAEIVRPGTNGWLATRPDEWEDALIAMHRDADQAARMGRAGRSRVEAEYSVKAVSGRYVELFRSLA